MKVLRTNNQVVYNAEKPNQPAYIYLRIAGSQTIFLTGEHHISSQYYRIENGKGYLLKAEENKFTKEQWEQLRSSILQGEYAAFDTLSNDGHQQALYLGALALIGQGQIYGTLPQDWSFFDVTPELEAIHTSSILF
jgi:hypothetical protein